MRKLIAIDTELVDALDRVAATFGLEDGSEAAMCILTAWLARTDARSESDLPEDREFPELIAGETMLERYLRLKRMYAERLPQNRPPERTSPGGQGFTLIDFQKV
jgi:hypothetical protein